MKNDIAWRRTILLGEERYCWEKNDIAWRENISLPLKMLYDWVLRDIIF
jgi:hypothetical protein